LLVNLIEIGSIVIAPILPATLSEYLIQTNYTPSRSDKRKIRVQFSLPDEVCYIFY